MKVSSEITSLAQLSDEKRKLLARLLEDEDVGAFDDQQIPVRPAGAALKLSFAQRRIWLLEQLHPNTSVYHIPFVYRLEGPLNVAAVERALAEIVTRHEVLRTSFILDAGEPQQVVRPAHDFELPLVDLTNIPPDVRALELELLLSEQAQRAFDLCAAAPWRSCLLRLDACEHVLMLVVHHIIADGWSFGVLRRELSLLYDYYNRAQRNGNVLSKLDIQYADYALWQCQQLAQLDKQLSYWRAQLDGLSPLLQLPMARPRPPHQSYRGASVHFQISPAEAERLQQLCKRHGVTLFMTLLAGFQLLLARYTGQSDIAVGTPIAGRTRSETESLIGCFVNTLVLRANVNLRESFSQLLKHVREVCLAAYANQDVPFEKLVEELQPERSLDHAPLFQVMFSLFSKRLDHLELAGLKTSSLKLKDETTKFDLMLVMSEQSDGGFDCSFQYSTDLFDQHAISRMVQHFTVLLHGIVIEPDKPLLSIPWLSREERRQVLDDWNQTARDYPLDQTLQSLFEAQVERTPDDVALVCGDQSLTYGELNQRANQVAHYLRERGVRGEHVVGILQHRSVEMVVSVLGVLKAGGAYLPLDVAYPEERLRYMVEDAGARLVLSEPAVAHKLNGCDAEVICLDGVSEQLQTDLAVRVDSQNLAYVIYTSGSTGRPKGVCIPHRNATTLVHWAREQFSAAELDGVLASTSLCFDLSVFELFVPLSCGGKIILVENALELLERKNSAEVRLINTVPSAMTELVRTHAVPATVRTVNLAGEPLQKALVESVYQAEGIERVYNLYGPSEDTTYTTYALIKRGDREAPSIGRPLANTRIYLLDANLEPVPVGVPGELYVAGAGLARGYLGSPELTAEKFVPDALSGRSGERLYRTGDLARYRSNGEIEYLGRLDHQVKLRGFRIELGEIESTLAECAGVKETLVVIREDTPGEQRLVAYVVGDVAASVLRRYLDQRLPKHMLPSHFVLLDQLPLLPNGKVNRHALPAPDGRVSRLEKDYVEPRTPTEEIVAEIFSRLLEVEPVGATDNFFELGGHSLLAMQVVSQVQKLLGISLPLIKVFEAPTVAALAEIIDSAGERLETCAIERVSRDKGLPLSLNQEARLFREWRQGMQSVNSKTFHSYFTVRIAGPLDCTVLERSINEIVRRHEILRSSFSGPHGLLSVKQLRPLLNKALALKPVYQRFNKLAKTSIYESGIFRQVIKPALSISLPLTNLVELDTEKQDQRVNEFLSAEIMRPFDYANGPMLRASLLRLDDETHIFNLTLHHLLSDGVSLQVLYRELLTVYEAFANGLPSPLPELAIQYGDFAAWQRRLLQGEFLDQMIDYWKQQLAGVGPFPVIELPFSKNGNGASSYLGTTQSVTLPDQLFSAIKSVSRDRGVTLYMLLLATLHTLLFRYTGKEHIGVMSAIANRSRPELEGLIGWVSNNQILSSRVSAELRFSELLEQVRETTLGAYKHQELPLPLLVRDLLVHFKDYRMPAKFYEMPYVYFNMNTQTQQLPQLSGLSITPVDIPSGTAENGIAVGVTQRENKLKLSISYPIDKFDGADVNRMLEDFQTLLEGVVNNPESPLRDLISMRVLQK